ncbi:CHAT domain-containing protein [Geodermatophilus sp. SYSU D00710]
MDEYESRDHLPALDAAIDVLRETLALVGNDDPQRPVVLASLGAALSTRARRLGRGDDLAESVKAAREAVARPPLGHEDLGRFYSNLTDALLTRFDRVGDTIDLDEAIAAGRRAVQETPPDHAMLARRLTNLAGALSARFEAVGAEADLAAAVDAARTASTAERAGTRDHGMALSALGDVLLSRFDRHGDPADLAAAAEAFRGAAATAPPSHPDRLAFLCNLGIALWRSFETTDQSQALDAAIASLREAQAGLAPDHPHHVTCVENLGNALHSRFERTGQLADLEEALDVLRLGVQSTPAGHPDRPAHLSNLAIAQQSRYERLNDPRDAECAIGALEEAVELTPQPRPQRATYLANLANALTVRSQASGSDDDLDRAVDALRQAIAAAPADHPQRSAFLAGLGNVLTVRFRRHGAQVDVDAAVGAARQAVTATPPAHPDLAGHQANLSITLRDRFHRTHDHRDIEAAVSAAQAAVEATPGDHPDRATYLTNLSNALRSRFDSGGRRSDLDAAIDAAETALAATPVDHPYRPARLSNLGSALRARHAATGGRADLDTAVDRLREAVATIPTDHPNRAGMMHNLGRALRTLSALTGDNAHADEALTCDREASGLVTAPPEVRLTAARAWGRFARDTGDVRSAADGYAAAVTLLPLTAWHGLERRTRELHLVDNAGLATEAVIAVLEAGDLPRAVELLEQARSVLWTQALHMRSDLTRLAERVPHLAARLDRIREELGQPTTEAEWTGEGGNQDGLPARLEQSRTLERRRKLAIEWDALVDQARTVEGFRHFLAPIPFAVLRQAAARGPVVVLVAGEERGYALVVTTTGTPGVDVVDLPQLTHEAAVTQANLLLTTTSGDTARTPLGPGAMLRTLGRRMSRTWTTATRRKAASSRDLAATTPATDGELPLRVLEWLWDAAAQPVLEHLGYTGGRDEEHLPRLWWSPVGPLAVLPLHAAGRHTRDLSADGPVADSVPGRLVSSYTPTLAALLRARSGTTGAPRQLAVGMSRTPRMAPLPAVTRELAILSTHFPPPEDGRQLLDRTATRSAVLRDLSTHPWVHFACHGLQDETEPSRSAFVLWDGRLTLDELVAVRLDSAELAFLSACQTATGSPLLLDEAIHLAAAMQLLGYRHVIGTLWTVVDAAAPDVAEVVYERLDSDGRSLGHTAEALHAAVDALRARHPDRPLLWAPYVHFGP